MRNRRRTKLVAIIVLCVSILGLTLGFAAFSNTLTISSSATVKPDSSDFKMTIYGTMDPLDEDAYTSTTESVPTYDVIHEPNISAGNAKINNDTMTISVDDVNFLGATAPVLYYYFIVVNEGEYDAYISQSTFPSTKEISDNIVCTPIDDVSEELLASACENVYLEVTLANNADGYFGTDDDGHDEYYMTIHPGEDAILKITIGMPAFTHNKIYADGSFSVSFPDVKLDFTTVKP